MNNPFQRFVAAGLVLLLSVLAVSPALADKLEDWKQLVALNDTFNPFRSGSSGTHDADFVAKWKAWRGEFTPFIQQFKANYGSDQTALRKSFENMELPKDVLVYPHHLTDLINLDVAAHQKKIAEWIMREGDLAYDRWEAMKNPAKDDLELKTQYAQKALAHYQNAQDLSPGVATEKLAKVQSAYDTSMAEFKKTLPEIKWPGNNPNFSGPGDPQKLAQEALKLLNQLQAKGQQWSRPEYDDTHIPFAACVVGDRWSVSKTAPLTQEPTQYALKFFVAFKGTQDPDIAYGYYMYFYTAEKASIKAEPPFVYCNSEQYAKHKILVANVLAGLKAQHKAAGSGNIVLRILLALLLILGSIIALEDVLRKKLPQFGKAYDQLTQRTPVISLALLGIGLLAFLKTVIFLVPLADILAQAGAVILGLTLLPLQGLNSKIPNEKLQAALTKLAPLSQKLAPYRVMTGAIALVLGLMHLLAGGIILF